MKITIRVTKKLIEKHWNGGPTSCPIHAALHSILRVRPVFVREEDIKLGFHTEVLLPRRAQIFSINQAGFCASEPRRKEALRILKPITFKLDIPKRYLRKGVRG